MNQLYEKVIIDAETLYCCVFCKKQGVIKTFKHPQSVNNHRLRYHQTKQHIKIEPKSATVKAKEIELEPACEQSTEVDQLKSEKETLCSVIHELNQMVEWYESQYDRIIKNISTKQKTTVKPTVPKQLKTKIWQNAHGTESVTGKCYCCGMVDLHITCFEAGHLISHANGGEMSEKNLRPICTGCNRGMGMKNMRDYAMVVHPLTSPLLKEKKPILKLKLRV